MNKKPKKKPITENDKFQKAHLRLLKKYNVKNVVFSYSHLTSDSMCRLAKDIEMTMTVLGSIELLKQMILNSGSQDE